jgi:hypothetical protein
MRYIFALLLFIPTTLMAERIEPEPYCKRLPFDNETPPWLIGKYEIIGKNQAGQTYAGDLLISIANNAYVLKKTVSGNSVKGEAWFESCSPDKFKRLIAKYKPNSDTSTFSCYLSADGDNFIRASCTSFNSSGLEAWYQLHEITP